MNLLMRVTCVVILLFGFNQFAISSTAYAQACGCANAVVNVGNEEGEAVKDVTVEFLYPQEGGGLIRDCLNNAPARQTGSGRKFKFRFGYPERGFERVLFRVSAPGYVTYEEWGELLRGCYARMEVVIRKSAQGYRTKAASAATLPVGSHAAPNDSFDRGANGVAFIENLNLSALNARPVNSGVMPSIFRRN